MSKAVLISIRPKWVEKIASGEKTIEVRKTRPKLDTPFKCYIYCTLQGCNEFFRVDLGRDVAKWNRGKWADRKGKVIGEFTCDRCCGIVRVGFDGVNERPQYFTRLDGWRYVPADDLLTAAQLTREDLEAYLAGGAGYGWHIADLLIYDQPKGLDEFTRLRETKFGSEPVTIKRPPQSWCYVEEG